MSQIKRKKVWSQAFAYGDEKSDRAVEEISRELNVSKILAILLYNRGYRDAIKAKEFICYETTDLHDPYLLNDMKAAVIRIEKAIQSNEKIYIYGDYDVDGVTSVSMLYLYLHSKGADVSIKIPRRDSEGYGVSCEALDKMAQEDTKLIITVDTGITAVEEVEYAKELGIDVVITDHHECRSILPDAVAVVNPHRLDSTYPFTDLAGVGVVFKLVCAYEMHLCQESGELLIDAVRRICYEYADLAAIGTIADVMPIVDENRLIVNLGLKLIENTKRKGLRALIDAATAGNKGASDPQNTKKKRITSGFIGYGIAPRINAAGRISDAMIAVKLLLCDGDAAAKKCAEELCEINHRRQLEENRIAEKAYAIIEEEELAKDNNVIVLCDNGWQQGIIGIVSSRITEKYGLPSILISFSSCGDEEMGTDIGKGSGRSIKGMNLVEALGHCEDDLVKYGGHELAAGLTIQRSQIESFKKRINEYASSVLSPDDFKISVYADCEIDMKDIDLNFAQSISLLEPCGVGNPTPAFIMRNVTVVRVMSIGAGKHTKLLLQKDGISVFGIYFGMSASVIGFEAGDVIDVLFNVDVNEFRGTKSVQMIVEDARISNSYVEKIESQKNRYEEIRGGAEFSESEDVIPDRNDFVQVYTVLRREYRSGMSVMDFNTLFKLVNAYDNVNINYIKLRYITTILNEMKICSIETLDKDIFKFEVLFNASKTNIEKSSILKKLKSQCKDRTRF